MADGNVYNLAENKFSVFQGKITVNVCKIKLPTCEVR